MNLCFVLFLFFGPEESVGRFWTLVWGGCLKEHEPIAIYNSVDAEFDTDSKAATLVVIGQCHINLVHSEYDSSRMFEKEHVLGVIYNSVDAEIYCEFKTSSPVVTRRWYLSLGHKEYDSSRVYVKIVKISHFHISSRMPLCSPKTE